MFKRSPSRPLNERERQIIDDFYGDDVFDYGKICLKKGKPGALDGASARFSTITLPYRAFKKDSFEIREDVEVEKYPDGTEDTINHGRDNFGSLIHELSHVKDHQFNMFLNRFRITRDKLLGRNHNALYEPSSENILRPTYESRAAALEELWQRSINEDDWGPRSSDDENFGWEKVTYKKLINGLKPRD